MAAPATSSVSSSSPSPSTNHSLEIYQKLHAYSFTSDPEFKLGLAVLLGQSGTPASGDQVNRTDNLVTKAKCFYFSRKFAIQPPIDFNLYNAWLQSQPPPPPSTTLETTEQTQSEANTETQTETETEKPVPNPDAVNTSSTASESANNIPKASGSSEPEPEQPAYPSSFAHIVELITTGQPIPGIQQIPDTVLTGQETASTAKKRRKPWEKEESLEGSGCDDKTPQELESAVDSQHEERAI